MPADLDRKPGSPLNAGRWFIHGPRLHRPPRRRKASTDQRQASRREEIFSHWPEVTAGPASSVCPSAFRVESHWQGPRRRPGASDSADSETVIRFLILSGGSRLTESRSSAYQVCPLKLSPVPGSHNFKLKSSRLVGLHEPRRPGLPIRLPGVDRHPSRS